MGRAEYEKEFIRPEEKLAEQLSRAVKLGRLLPSKPSWQTILSLIFPRRNLECPGFGRPSQCKLLRLTL